jgi:hypothetical protein
VKPSCLKELMRQASSGFFITFIRFIRPGVIFLCTSVSPGLSWSSISLSLEASWRF